MNDKVLSSSIIQLNEQILELIEFGKKKQNVHKKVKLLSRKLRATAERIAMDYKRTEAAKKEIKLYNKQKESLLQQKIYQLEKANAEYANKYKEIPDTDNICKFCKISTKADDNLIGIAPNDLSTFRSLLAVPWPAKAFKRTIFLEKDSTSVLPNHVVIMSDRLYIDKEQGRPSKLGKLEKGILSQFPNLDNKTPTKCPGGYNITLEVVTNCKIKGSGKKP